MKDLLNNEADNFLKARRQAQQNMQEMLNGGGIEQFIVRLKDEITASIRDDLNRKIAEDHEVISLLLSFLLQQALISRQDFLKYVKDIANPYPQNDARHRAFIDAKMWFRIYLNDPEIVQGK